VFVSPIPLLKNAKKRRYAIGAFNVYNLESVQAVVAAAEHLRSPVILQTSEAAIGYAGLDYLFNLASVAAAKSTVPVVLHLDHGKDLDTVKACIERGYSSIMFDGSHYPYAKNVKLTRKVVQMAHAAGIAVEAELGTIGGAEDTVRSRKILLTDPAEAKRFVEETGIDSLAIAIGTSHGAYKFAGKAQLDLQRLREIALTIGVPLVLHGASSVPADLVARAKKAGMKLDDAEGVPEEQIAQAVRNGISKVNIDTDLRLAWSDAVREHVKKEVKDFDPRHALVKARDAMQSLVEGKMRLLGSKGMA